MGGERTAFCNITAGTTRVATKNHSSPQRWRKARSSFQTRFIEGWLTEESNPCPQPKRVQAFPMRTGWNKEALSLLSLAARRLFLGCASSSLRILAILLVSSTSFRYDFSSTSRLFGSRSRKRGTRMWQFR